MLVLSRKVDETIVIDGVITIQVIKVNGKNVRLGITAPSHIKVLRGELDDDGVVSNSETTVFELDLEVEDEDEDGDGDEIKLDFLNPDGDDFEHEELPEDYPCTD